MDKNYYDILQVNQNASPEIIEKAYKVLAKKYHPDLQQTVDAKKQAEEILKGINEAYEVLSNPEKKKEYDLFLAEQKQTEFQNKSTNSSTSQNSTQVNSFSNEELNLIEQELLRQQKLQQERQYQDQLQREQQLFYQEQLQQARQKAYYDAYIQDLKSRGFKIRYKKTLKDYFRIFVTIISVALFLFVLWQLPFVQNYFLKLLEENDFLRSCVTFFTNLFHKN